MRRPGHKYNQKKVRKRNRNGGGIPRLLKGTVLLLCLIVLGLSVDRCFRFLTADPFFRVEAVDIDGLSALSEKEVRKIAAISDGANIFTLDMDFVAARIDRHPWIQGTTVRRELPRTVKITVKERVPVVYVNQKDRFFIADREGIVMGEVQSYRWNLPVVYGVDLRNIHFGEGPPPLPLRKAIEVRNHLASDPDLSKNAFVGIEVTPPGDVVLHYKETSVQLGRGDFPEKLKRLHEIEKEVEDQGIPLKEVDLRYGDQAVVRTL